MLPPTLEIFVVWHPHDTAGRDLAQQVFDHFHGTTFSGLLGGAIEVYMRSVGWNSPDDAPRAVPYPATPSHDGVVPAQFVVVLPLIGNEFASVLQADHPAWTAFVNGIVSSHNSDRAHVAVFPYAVNAGTLDGTKIGAALNMQRIVAPTPPIEPLNELVCRDLAQGAAQLVRPGNPRLKVFISHTKRMGHGEAETAQLIHLVREIIGETHLQTFFDANDLQAGSDWDNELRTQAATSAMLVLRTDLYATREWCQREMLIAKRHGMPVVTLDCVAVGEERGSFLMDHVPRVPLRKAAAGWNKGDVRRGLNLLVDECLKRELWNEQRRLAARTPFINVSWWAPHAPEPATLLQWMEDSIKSGMLRKGAPIRVLHPDPPLGLEEFNTLGQLARLAGHNEFDILTPRTLASRGV